MLNKEKTNAASANTGAIDIDFAERVIQAEGRAVMGLSVLARQPVFEETVRQFLECSGSVIVTGMGKAGIVAHKISATLASTGTASHFLHPAEAVHGDLGRIQTNDIVLALSHSGESEEIVRLIEPLKQREIKLISIVGDSQSRLAVHSDIVLCMGMLTEACPLGVAPTVSTTCMLALGDALALTTMKARDFSVEDYARFHPAGALGRKLLTVGQTMWFKPGESLPLAMLDDTIEEMLVKNETTKRRGAVMVTDASGKLAGIITDADLRRAMAKSGVAVFACKTAELMTPNCKRVREDALAAEAMAIFHKYRIDELPVIDADDKPVGLIDVQDIVAIKIVG
ncbi:MAG: KpsF/GutQ family sugar-phosphate isomerase [Phycisphaerae bacterium]|nr:KpsF/GutQ family sugar-phosphate isomerase [Phycisphaerae bacterium]